MKKLYPPDLSFIIISCLFFLGLNYWGHSGLLARFSYLILIVGYFSGKMISNYQHSKKLSKENKV